MAQTIGNPLSWIAQHLRQTTHHVSQSAAQIGSEDVEATPQVRALIYADLRDALKAGMEDFAACRSDALFLVVFYPLIGLALVAMSMSANMLQLVVPAILGFALIGPFAAVGLYEMSSRREAGFDASWSDALGVIRSPSFGAILMLGFYLAALFIGWLLAASMIYNITLGPGQPESMAALVTAALTTAEGWTMIVLGFAAGACFALAALAVSLVAFPLLLDRQAGLPVAVITSFRVLKASPAVVISWGALVGVSLLIGALPFLLGLILVVPVLGHATWHLYRRAVA